MSSSVSADQGAGGGGRYMQIRTYSTRRRATESCIPGEDYTSFQRPGVPMLHCYYLLRVASSFSGAFVSDNARALNFSMSSKRVLH